MRLTIKRDAFVAIFQKVAAVAPSRSPKAILDNVLMRADESGVDLMATDMELAIRARLEGIDVTQSGNALLPVARFGAFLRESSDEMLSVEVGEDAVEVKGTQGFVKFQAHNPDEFPAVTGFAEEAFYRLPASRFKELIRRTVFATDVDSSRYALGGVLFEFGDKVLTAVATDGRRLARMEVAIEKQGEPIESDANIIVPTNNLQLIERTLPDSDDPVDIAPRSNDLLVRCGSIDVYSRLVEGRFPRWRDVFPDRKSVVCVNLNVQSLHSAIRQASVVANSETRGLDFTFQEGSLVLTLTAADVGDSRIEIPIAYDGDALDITLDYRYFADFLKVMNPEQSFEMEIENDEAAALCRTDDGYGYVIMPLARDRR